jgi:hypothetical protein
VPDDQPVQDRRIGEADARRNLRKRHPRALDQPKGGVQADLLDEPAG